MVCALWSSNTDLIQANGTQELIVILSFTFFKTDHEGVPVCVVGAGPAGYYTTLALLNSGKDIRVDILEQLPVPFGLVRSGVAPDHQDVCILFYLF